MWHLWDNTLKKPVCERFEVDHIYERAHNGAIVLGDGICDKHVLLTWLAGAQRWIITEKGRQPVHIGFRMGIEENYHVAFRSSGPSHACTNESRAFWQVNHSNSWHVLLHIIVQWFLAMLCKQKTVKLMLPNWILINRPFVEASSTRITSMRLAGARFNAL